MSNIHIPRDLTPEEAAGMIVNERLFVAGLLNNFDEAVERKDRDALAEILRKVYLSQANIEAIIEVEFGNK